MKSQGDPSVPQRVGTSQSTGGSKRKTTDEQKRRRQSTLPEVLTKPSSAAPDCSISSYRDQASTKRMKSSHRASNDTMNLGIIFRPEKMSEQIQTSTFQPHAGAKKLIIKNLRTAPRFNTQDYYEKTWEELDSSLTAIFQGKQPRQPLERLYRGAEDLCRKGRAQELFKHLVHRCEAYLTDDVLSSIKSESGSSNIQALRVVERYWMVWTTQSMLIRSVFSYLDRSYLLGSKEHPQLNDLAISQFRRMIFVTARKDVTGESLGGRVLGGMCDLVQLDRANQPELFDSGLLKDSVTMLHIFGVYGKSFEPRLIACSVEFFKSFVEERATIILKDYISACEKLLYREGLRCDTYNFDGTTKRALLAEAQRLLIEERTLNLLDEAEVAKLIDSGFTESLKALYELLRLSKIQGNLRAPWEGYIKRTGATIVGDLARGDDMIVRLLEMKRSLDTVIRDAFYRDEHFTYGLREAFGNFINDKKTTTAWGTGSSKVGEMIAKYIDLLLRGGLKAVPRSLISDSIDRDASEKSGQASTGDEDAELDRQLDQGLELFRFIEGKDVFEAFYKKDLARRLLMGRSASQDAERNMLTKLKSECGSSFTHNLEQMFKDQELARDEMISYKQSLRNTSKTSMDLQVSVLSQAAWPTYPDVKVNLPAEVAKHIEKYDRHYKHKHTGRRLTWKHALAHSVVKAQFGKSAKELVVSGFQAIVLVLFNDVDAGAGENLSYEALSTATGLVDAELQRTLQSLACAKFRILTKHPKGRDVTKTDTFTVNLAFSDPKYRIKINQVQLKETKEENKETHERVVQDRQYETQAAIVRIMKSRKSMTHANLVAEVINQTKSRGAVEPGEIKKNIEKLIEKEYLEREDGAYTYLA